MRNSRLAERRNRHFLEARRGLSVETESKPIRWNPSTLSAKFRMFVWLSPGLRHSVATEIRRHWLARGPIDRRNARRCGCGHPGGCQVQGGVAVIPRGLTMARASDCSCIISCYLIQTQLQFQPHSIKVVPRLMLVIGRVNIVLDKNFRSFKGMFSFIKFTSYKSIL